MKSLTWRRATGALVGSLGVGLIVTAALGSSADADPRYSVEVLPVEQAKPIEVESLDDVANRGDLMQLLERAVADLSASNLRLGKLNVENLAPVYRDDDPAVIGVAADLLLAEPTDLTMELRATVIDSRNELAGQSQLAEISNLRGLTIQVSVKSGEVINLTPMPFLNDVDRPSEATTVDFLIAEQTRLPDGVGLEEE